MALTRPTSALDAYSGKKAFAGDLHNHCGISYGHGSIEAAYANARQQLDFASVTGHAAWHDIPHTPPAVRQYHLDGFERLASQWQHVQDVTESYQVDHEFVSFISFEWHSLTYGDHCVYFKSGAAPLEIAQAGSLEELRSRLRTHQASGVPTMLIPHHIGYRNGFRGINWSTYTEELSPVIELVSMHGSGEAEPGPRAYLHTMGPRDGASTAQFGLDQGHVFGFIGSTDHHSAHPGSHGYGRAMVWADELTRDGIWSAIQNRRTYAVTGDRIMLATTLNDAPMGSVITAEGTRHLSVDVLGGDEIDYVEILRNNQVIDVLTPVLTRGDAFDGILAASFGWGEHGVEADWNATIRVRNGRILSVEPRFHGQDVVDPTRTDGGQEEFISVWTQTAADTIQLRSRTFGNPTVMTDGTQQIAIHVEGDGGTVLEVTQGEFSVSATVDELRAGSRSGYTGGFLSPAVLLHRAVDHSQRAIAAEITDTRQDPHASDWYYARVRQRNDQYAWSSPIWVSDTK